MPDRFDLSTPSDLEISLGLASKWCKTTNPDRVPAQHCEHLNLAREWLTQQHPVVQQWLAGTLRTLDDSSESFPTEMEHLPANQAVSALGEVIAEVEADVVRLARCNDTVHSLPAGGRVMGLDFARHVVRVACCATIDRGWPWG
ncbi:hypothetical protein MO973_04095 [Paenibacillus sp. TRM 82003]|uniref:hypothetical protein n=1 Tax=Kineococcus sp. TRM81007 TaxID=2925831 RepID=UPI001F56F811|nr:hypothetical protein [Kineococcus sp. TRM81007]MCI2237228.1 hypothetical protein [Kineococcus sp. TRM81007]MCI3919410.1 hypothetical protein [Paenibacillus sp. TRM 82003]